MIPSAPEFLLAASPGQVVVDVGCHGWRLIDACVQRRHRLIGVDQKEPPNRPVAADFAIAKNGCFDLPDDIATIVVASHVLEHVNDAVGFFREIMRVAKPGGLLWIEAPSELSILAPGSDDPTDHQFLCFWDDPTHIRPYTPGALYRLAIGCYCLPRHIERADSGGIPVVRMIGVKPSNCYGAPPTTYVSLRDVAPGLDNAWRHIWGNSF